MGRYDSPSDAEIGFFNAISDNGQVKRAMDLEGGTLDALGIPSVSKKILDDLEAGASSGSTSEEAPTEENQPQEEIPDEAKDQEPPEDANYDEAPAEDSVKVEGFARNDGSPDEEEAVGPELPSRATHGKLFGDKRAHPIQLLEILTARYGTTWTEWESDTLWWSLRKNFGSVGEVARNKIMALRIATTRDIPWLDWDVFEDCGLSWNDIIPTIGSFQPMTPVQLAFAIKILRAIRPDEEFNNEVQAYIAAILDDHGWVWAPPEYFGDVQEILERDREHLVGLKQQVISAWKKVKNVDPETIDWVNEDALTIHIMKLFAVKSYLEGREDLYNKVHGGGSTSSTVSPPVP